MASILGAANAATRTWDGGGSDDNWDTVNNWNNDALPGTTDDVVFGSGFVSGTTINLSGNRVVNSLAINTITAFSLTGGHNLTLTSGQLTRNDVAGTEGDHAFNGTIILGASGLFTINGSGTFTLSGGIQDGTSTFNFTKAGSGVLVISGGGKTYNGDTIVSAGTLRLGAANQLTNGTGFGNVVIQSGATLDLANFSDTINGLSGSGTVDKSGTTSDTLIIGANNVSATFSGTIMNSGSSLSLRKNGTGTQTLSGANSYSGTTMIAGGVLRLDHANALGNGNLDLNGGVLGLGAGDFTRSIGTNAGEVRWSNASGGFAAYGADRTVNIGGAGATLATGTTGVFGNAVGNHLILGAADATHTLNFVNGINFNSGNSARTIQVDNGAADVDAVISGVIQGSSTDWNKTGTGTLRLTGNNTFTTAVNVNAGALRVAHVNALGTTAAGTTVASGAALELTGGLGGTGVADALSLNGTGISNGGALRNVSGDNTYSGSIALTTASRINSDSGTLTIRGGVTGLFGVTFGGAGNISVNTTAISTVAGIVKDGNGTLTLGVANTYTGGTTVNGGTLLANATGATGSGAVSVGVSGTLGGTGSIAPTTASGMSVSGVLAPGSGVGSIGTLTLNMGGTLGTAVMNSGASFAFDLGLAGTSITSLGSSDLLAIAGAATGDFTFNSNSINALGGGTNGFYKLFDTSHNATTWSGLTFNGTSGVVTAGLSITNLAAGKTGTLIVGTASNGGSLGDIYLSVIPEPSTALLAGLGSSLLFRRRRIRS